MVEYNAMGNINLVEYTPGIYDIPERGGIRIIPI
jgi:hypothetical protein